MARLSASQALRKAAEPPAGPEASAARRPPPRNGTWQREELLHLLTLSGTLAGLSITGVTLFHTLGKASVPGSIADDMLAGSALLFLLCTYTIFFALRTKKEGFALVLEKLADALFLLALTGMIGAGFVMIYTVW
jgi:hypothetical protein